MTGNVTRILDNRTYTGSMAYGKSYSNNYLEQRRIPNHDASTYWVVKSDFPAIISEEDFEKCRQIRESRTVQTMKKAIDLACRMIQESFRAEPKQDSGSAGIAEQLDRLKRKKERLVELYTEEAITKEEFAAQKERIGKETDRLNRQLEEMKKQADGNREEAEPHWTAIRETLTKLADITPGHVSEDLVKKLVAKVIPSSPTRFRWYLRLDGSGENALDCTVEGRKNRAVVILDDGEPSQDPSDPDGIHRDFRYGTYAFGMAIGNGIHEQNNEKMPAPDAWHLMWSGADLIFRFEIGFEEAEAWRKRRGQYLRRNAYETIEVEVVI